MSMQRLVARFCKKVSVIKFVILTTRDLLACAGERQLQRKNCFENIGITTKSSVHIGDRVA
jgi:hypothetical protein